MIIKKNNTEKIKGGKEGNKMWKAHRLEGVVKNKGIKPVKKSKKGKTK